MPSVLVVPVYIEVPDVGRAVLALESHIERAGYIFHVGQPLVETLEDTKTRVMQMTGQGATIEPVPVDHKATEA